MKLKLPALGVIALAAGLLSGMGDKPETISLPSNPIERAAFQGLITSYEDSTMWQVQKAEALNTVPVAPTAAFLQQYDPKELYCVCVVYEARYKVEWTTTKPSDWKRTVRNVLVMKTQGDTYLPIRPMNICAPFCE
jgi:hypothetical protein